MNDQISSAANPLAQWLASARKSQAWSREALALRSGVSAKTIQRIEEGADAQYSTVLALAQALQLVLMVVPQAQAGFARDVVASDGRLVPLPTQRSAPMSAVEQAIASANANANIPTRARSA
jgi:transcriptional regulator with XRE-family HTH domain